MSNSYDIVSTTILLRLIELSIDPKSAHNKLLSMGSGLFLLVFSIMVVVLDSSNFLAFGLAFFVLMIGIMLVMIGAVEGMDNKKKESVANQSATTTQIVHEIVKVRCKYCNSLNYETSERCINCGAQL
jgi:ABC-type bacteriocin/lantibiotic exporter with double-glycine peptidase domain